MGKLIGILIVLAIVAGAVYYFTKESDAPVAVRPDGPVRVEEKYGVTTETGGK